MLPELHIQRCIHLNNFLSNLSVLNCAWALMPEQVVLWAWELTAPCIAHAGPDGRYESCSVTLVEGQQNKHLYAAHVHSVSQSA